MDETLIILLHDIKEIATSISYIRGKCLECPIQDDLLPKIRKLMGHLNEAIERSKKETP